MSDPRIPETAAKYIQLFNQLHELGKGGFAYMLDSATEPQLDDLISAADVLLGEIARTKHELGQ
jgi:hypothetical protein